MIRPLHLTSLDLVLVVFSFSQLMQTFHLHRWWLSPVATCAGGAFSFSHWRKQSTCTRGGVTLCNLHWWCFFSQPLPQILHLHPGNLHCVVVVSGGGIYVYIYFVLWCNLFYHNMFVLCSVVWAVYTRGKHNCAVLRLHT